MDLDQSDIWQIFKVVDILIVPHKIKDFDKPDFVMYSQFIERNGKDDITIRYYNKGNKTCNCRISGIHALYVLIEKRFSQFKVSQNFLIVNNAKLLLDIITNCMLCRNFLILIAKKKTS